MTMNSFINNQLITLMVLSELKNDYYCFCFIAILSDSNNGEGIKRIEDKHESRDL